MAEGLAFAPQLREPSFERTTSSVPTTSKMPNTPGCKPTGVTFHEDMNQHRCLWDPNYPEKPERFSVVLKRCQELGLIDECTKIPPRLATTEEILWKHTSNTIKILEECEAEKEVSQLEEISSHYDAIFICPETYRLARLAAGSTIDLVRSICEDKIQNGMAIVRPPGHHAMKSEYCGYCFFNNVALAADDALKNHNISRILIVDWDVHHGQGTQQMFYDDKRVLYFSIHRYEHGTFWPNLRESEYDYIGEGQGTGYNFNVPLNKTGFGNAEYLAIFHELLLPIATEYDPELIIVSAGYDAALGCFEGEMEVTPACYAHLLSKLYYLANGKVAVILEGGYFLSSLAEGAALTLRSLLGEPCPDIGPVGAPHESIRETIRNVIYSHREYWNCFKIYDLFDSTEHSVVDVRDHHTPVIKFDYHEKPLQVFPTRECYPIRLKETELYYQERVEKLISDTSLRSTLVKCLSLSSEQSNYSVVEQCRSTSQIDASSFLRDSSFIHTKWKETLYDSELREIITKYQSEHDISLLRLLVQVSSPPNLSCFHVMNNETRSAIVELSGSNYEKFRHSFYLNPFLDIARHKFNLQRILVINLTPESTNGQLSRQCMFSTDNDILNIEFTNEMNQGSVDLDTKNEKYYVKINFNDENFANFEYVTAWLKIVLPISYEFNPQLVIVVMSYKNGKYGDTSFGLFGHLLQWLSSLANGKLILITDDTSNKFHEWVRWSIQDALVGTPPELYGQQPVPTGFSQKHGLFINKKINEKYVSSLKDVILQYETHWHSLIRFVKFPISVRM